MADEAELKESQDVVVLLRILARDHGGRGQAFPSQIRVGAVLEQQLGHLHLVLHRGQRQRGEADGLLALHGGLRLEQELRDLHVAVLRGKVQGHPARDVRGVDVGARLQQRRRGLRVASVGCSVQGCSGVLINRLYRRLGLEQHLHRRKELHVLHGALLHLFPVGSEVQGGPAALVRSMDEARLLAQEEGHGLYPPVASCQQQRCGLRAVRNLQVGAPLLYQHAHNLRTAQQHGPVQRRLLVRVQGVDLAAAHEELERQLAMVLCTSYVEWRLHPEISGVDLAAS
mmetsp:Transcript_63432/g.185469  ORF Transcript_63432/g.185469 Transcript_63432/m.185469 type:complete len:285 (+) Transcript_63432:101-955(+)